MRSYHRQRGFLGSIISSIGSFVGNALGSITGNGLLSAGASLLSGSMSSAGQADANAANIAMSREQRDWQTQMSNTSYQRAVEDMKLAGLNPMLAYSQGGASTPTGGIGNPIINRQAAMVDALTKVASTAASVDNLRANTSLLEENVNKTKAETENIRADTAVKGELAPYHKQATMTSAAQADKIREETNNIKFTLTNILPAQADQMSTQALLNNVRAALEKERGLTEPVRRHLMHLESVLVGLSIPEAKNRSAVQDSWWMKNVSPYLPDALKSSTILRRHVDK